MALDGIYLHFIKKELEEKILNSRIDKIYQPSKEELILSLRGGLCDGSVKLLFSANAGSSRVHITDVSVSNPKVPPMFCMLLRKHLGGGRLIRIEQPDLERILYFVFECHNELGDTVELTLSIEIMGRHSNIIVFDATGRILDAIKRVDFSISQVRQILPGMQYTAPPVQDKCNLLRCDVQQVLNMLHKEEKKQALDKWLLAVLQGISPIVCREIMYFASHGEEIYTDCITPAQESRIQFFLNTLQQMLLQNQPKAVLLAETSGKPKEFSFMDIRQYGHHMLTREYPNLSMLLDAFYRERSSVERMKQRSEDMLKLVVNATQRIHKKINLQMEELKGSSQQQEYKLYGDLLTANLYALKKGDKQARCQNFYSPDMEEITIALDESLTPAQNAQKYYKKYKKAESAKVMLQQQIEKGRQELLYLDSVFDAISRTTSEEELNEIRSELYQQRYIKRVNKKQENTKALKPRKYISEDGFTIWVGRNNLQNDRLTLRESQKNDIWLHVKDMPGSHTVIETGGQTVPESTLLQAALLAGYHSKGRYSSGVAIDYTEVKNVKKPAGAKPGLVIYVNNRTLFVTPQQEEIDKIKEVK